MEKQTNWASILCMALLAMSFFGMCCNVFGAGSLLLGRQMAAINPAQAQMVQAQQAYAPLLTVVLGLGLLQSLFLFVTAALGLRDLERVRNLLRTALKVTIAVVALQLIVNLFVQLQQLKVGFPKLPGTNAPAVDGIMQIAGTLGLIWAVLWSLAKGVFYFFVHRYFGNPPTPTSAPESL